MKEKAIYIGAVVLTAIWGVAAPEGFAPFLLGFELLLALSMWILVQILAGKVEIVPEPAEETVGKKEPIVLRVKLKMLPCFQPPVWRLPSAGGIFWITARAPWKAWEWQVEKGPVCWNFVSR